MMRFQRTGPHPGAYNILWNGKTVGRVSRSNDHGITLWNAVITNPNNNAGSKVMNNSSQSLAGIRQWVTEIYSRG